MKTRQSLSARFPWMVFTLFFISISILSCSKDEAEPVIDAKNELTYNGQTYPLNYGAVDDYGYDGSHTNYEFHLFHIISETDPVVPTYLFIDLFSPNENGFKGDTFRYIDTDNGEVDLEGKYYFDDAYFAREVDIENNTVGEYARITGGTVNVSGSGMDYTLEFDLVTEDGKSLKGSYGGTFEPMASANTATASSHRAVQILNKRLVTKSGK